jgi:formylglycine-generating enzyme required for sulfatase activity
VKSAPPDATAAPPGQACSRCAQHLRPDWNYCPTCALPVRLEEEILSSEIRGIREKAAAGARVRHRESRVLRWAAAGVSGALVLGTAAVGIALFNPNAASLLSGGGTETPPPENPHPAPVAGGLAYVWVTVQGGPFKYGPPEEGRGWTGEAEVPTFQILKYEVTNAQWREYLEDQRDELRARNLYRGSVPSYWTWGPKDLPPEEQVASCPEDEENLPVRGVSFTSAAKFCLWLDGTGRSEVKGARLPREYEWEKAARGTDGRVYPWGKDFDVRTTVPGSEIVAPAAHVNSPSPVPVNFSRDDVSPSGCLHMGGNVSEWTGLWGGFSEDSPARYRVIRGASFQLGRAEGAEYAKTWNDSLQMEPGLSFLDVGFRIARDAPPREGAGDGGK